MASIKATQGNETLINEIPVERIDGKLHRFRFQVKEIILFYFLN